MKLVIGYLKCSPPPPEGGWGEALNPQRQRMLLSVAQAQFKPINKNECMPKLNKLILQFIAFFLPIMAFSQRQMEYLNRGVVAMSNGKGANFVSWRLLATDDNNIGFNIYRSVNNGKAVKLNANPVTTTTSFLDEKADSTQSYTYQVAATVNGKEVKDARVYTVKPAAPVYISIPLKTPAGYAPNDASVGDLDGDGTYEIVLHQAGAGRDNSQKGVTSPPILE